MTLSLAEALRWTERLAAVAVLLSAFELLRVRAVLQDDGVYGWPTLRDDYRGCARWLRKLLDTLLAWPKFLLLLVLQLALALLLLFHAHALWSALLWLGSLLVSVRFRGSYNGGSDAMLLVVLSGATLARVSDLALVQRAALGYVCAQAVLSYAISGLFKLREPAWRDGSALPRLFVSTPYPFPAWAERLFRQPSRARVAAWSVIALECSFPLALLDERVAPWLLALGVAFHLVNVALLGLNRFFWSWLAAYPALVYFSLSLEP